MTTEEPKPFSLVDWVARNRQQSAGALVAIGVLLVVLTIFWALRYTGGQETTETTATLTPTGITSSTSKLDDKADYLPACVWSGLLAVLCLGTGTWQLSRKEENVDRLYETRLWLLSVGGTFGLLTFLLGAILTYRWQKSLLAWVNDGEMKEARWVLAGLSIILAGLVIVFLSVQLARAEERRSVVFRRILYGSNAVLSGLLLLLLLAVVNVIVFLKLPDNVITTTTAFKGLSEPGKEFLKTFDDDVTLYLIMPEAMQIPVAQDKMYNGLYADCLALLNACREENRRITVKTLSPANDTDEIRQVMKDTPEGMRNQFGILIRFVKDEKYTAFLKWEELIAPTPQGAPAFQGENQLLTELAFLSGGATKPIIYITQGNGEPMIIPADRRSNVPTAIRLVEQLTRRKYEVRPLILDPTKPVDLKDAVMVIVGAPHVAYSPEQTEILKNYMLPKGKIPGGKVIAVLPAFPDLAGKVSVTGLEGLLDEFGVAADPPRRLFCLPVQDTPLPEIIRGTSSPDAFGPLSRFLPNERAYPFGDVRPLGTAPRRDGGRISFNVFVSMRNVTTYRDDIFDSDPRGVVQQALNEFREKREPRTEREKMFSNAPIPFAAYVGDISEEGKERPRLLVLGTDWFFSDAALAAAPNSNMYLDNMGTMVDYMREKPKGIDIPPHAFTQFALPSQPNGLGLIWLPMGLVMLGIVALGAGVWVTRRT